MVKIEPGTKVIVHSKSAGCSLRSVLDNDYCPDNTTPFVGWFVCMNTSFPEEVYTIGYTSYASTGDFYKEKDFELFYDVIFNEEDFLL